MDSCFFGVWSEKSHCGLLWGHFKLTFFKKVDDLGDVVVDGLGESCDGFACGVDGDIVGVLDDFHILWRSGQVSQVEVEEYGGCYGTLWDTCSTFLPFNSSLRKLKPQKYFILYLSGSKKKSYWVLLKRC